MSAATASAAATVTGAPFAAAFVIRVANIASTIACLICLEMAEGMIAAIWHRSRIAVVWIEAIIYVPVEAATAAEPGTCSEKNAAVKPIWPVIPVG
jgi:hypothetical protein